jgi:hypothetical protein
MNALIFFGSAAVVSIPLCLYGIPALERLRVRYLEPWSRRTFK